MKAQMKQNEIEKLLKNQFDLLAKMPWEDQGFYSQYLAQTYYYVSHSVSLLTYCCGMLGPEFETFRKRLIDHVHEEYGHQKLAVADLKHMGLDIKDFEEFPETSAFYESQMFKMNIYSPITLWGWILALEGLAVQAGDQFYQRVKAAHGEKAAIFLKVHVTEDEEHFRVALKTIEGLPPQIAKGVEQNLKQSMHMFTKMLEECQKLGQSQTGKFKKAA